MTFTQKAVADMLNISDYKVIGVMGHLEIGGWIEKRYPPLINPSNRRALVRLTRRGYDALGRPFPAYRAETENLGN